MTKLQRFLTVPVLLLAVVAALVLSSCGGDDSSDGPDPASITPASAPIYFGATIKPEGDTKEDLDGTLSKLLNTDDPGGLIRSQLSAALEEDGVSFEEDIDPWLGSTMGGWLSEFGEDTGEGAVAIAVTDSDKAVDAVDKLAESSSDETTEEEYEGTSYKLNDGVAYGIVDDFIVLGTEKGFQGAVDASGGDSLADDDAANEALDSVSDGAVAELFVDLQGTIDAALEGGSITQKDLDQSGLQEQLDKVGDGDVVAALTAGEDNLAFEASGPEVEDAPEATDIVAGLPAGAWLAFGASDVGDYIATTYQSFAQGFQEGFQESLGQVNPQLRDQLDVDQVPNIDDIVKEATGLDVQKDFAWVGDVGGFVQGTSVLDVGGGLVIETDDAKQATATLAKLRKALGRSRSLKIQPSDDGGFNISTPDVPGGAQVGIRDDKVVFAFAGTTIDEVLEPEERLEDSDRFETAQDALGDDLSPSFFLDVATLVSTIEGAGLGADPEYQAARPYLTAINFLVAGAGTEDDRSVGRFVLGVKEPSGDADTAAAAITP